MVNFIYSNTSFPHEAAAHVTGAVVPRGSHPGRGRPVYGSVLSVSASGGDARFSSLPAPDPSAARGRGFLTIESGPPQAASSSPSTVCGGAEQLGSPSRVSFSSDAHRLHHVSSLAWLDEHTLVTTSHDASVKEWTISY